MPTEIVEPATAGTEGSAPTLPAEELEKRRVQLTRRYYVTLGSLAALFVALVSAVYTLDRFLWITPLTQDLAKATQQITDYEASQKAIAKTLQETEVAYRLVIAERESPLLKSPVNDAEVVAREIPLRWHYEKQGPLQSYVVELVPADSPEEPPIIRQVVRPEEETYYLPSSLLKGHRKIFWRVVPGSVVNGRTLATGFASPYSAFTWDPSTIVRIKRTGRLSVGINPQLTGPFERLDGAGSLVGADIDLVNWLAGKMGPRLGMSRAIEVEFRALPWSLLLPSLEQRDVDIVISSMTRTADRERRFRGVKFTEGYYTTHQILISAASSNLRFPTDLNKVRTVGTITDTTNQQAARLLAQRYGFTVRADFKTFDDVYSALDARVIDLALVDDVFVYDKLAVKRFKQFGENLDDELKRTEFYKTVIGFDAEVYAIAVNDMAAGEAGEVGLLEILNELIRSEEGKEFVKALSLTLKIAAPRQ